MPEPDPPADALGIIARAGGLVREAGRLAAYADAVLSSGPPETAAALLAMALLENRDAQRETRLALPAAQALLKEGEAIGRARERAAIEAERAERRSRLRVLRLPSPPGKEPATVG